MGDGAYVNVVGRLPPARYTIRLCVVDIPCTRQTFKTRDGNLSTIGLDLDDHPASDLEGETLTVSIKIPNGTVTRSTRVKYTHSDGGGMCSCPDHAYAVVRFPGWSRAS